jgi:Membrane bound O-acyl transferase family
MSFSAWPPWVVMWGLAAAIYAACKWLTWARASTPGASAGRQLAYLFAWPGMDAKAFLDPRPIPDEQKPTPGEWLFAAAKLAVGAGLVWVVSPDIPVEFPLLRGWVGMAGLVFLLHFGTFHLLSCVWRTVGVDVRPLMNWPILSTGLSEFWGMRWNTAFRDLTYRFLFRPLAGRIGPRWGLTVGFLASGIVHDLVISVPAGGGYGLPTLYFVGQGIGLLVERSAVGKSYGLGRGWRGRAFAAAVIAGPAFGLFHPPFVTRVVLPFLDAIGAG